MKTLEQSAWLTPAEATWMDRPGWKLVQALSRLAAASTVTWEGFIRCLLSGIENTQDAKPCRWRLAAVENGWPILEINAL
jgi:hypothetical protein